MTAGQLLTLDQNMMNGSTSYRTDNAAVPTTTDISGTYAGEIDSIEIRPAVGVNGVPVFGGTDMWFNVDGQNYQHYVDVPCDAVNLPFPLHSKTFGGSPVARLLGTPFWRLCLRGLGGATVPSMPTLNSTIKYLQYFGISIYAIDAWTAAAGYPLRIIIKGWIYQPQDFDYLSAGWQTSIQYQTEDRDVLGAPALDTTFALAAPAMDNWQQMPGGVNENGPKVNPYVHYAVTNKASDANTRFVLSNSSVTYGNSSNVQTDYQDTGLNGATENLAFILQAYGVTVNTRPSNIGRFGFVVDGTEVPANPNVSSNGIETSDDNSDDWFGDSGPWDGDEGTGTGYSGFVRPIPTPDGQPMLIYQNKFAAFVAANGTPIPKGAVTYAEQGVLVENIP